MGRAYQVQYKPDVSQTNWANAGSRLTATNTVMIVIDPAGPILQRYYRVYLSP